MKFLIAVDCEGVAGVVGTPGKTLNESQDFAFAKAQATREADAAARALFDAGAERVIVWDAHSGGWNLDYALLDRRCELAIGRGFAHRCPGMDSSFAGLLFIGYHAMEGTAEAVLAHTMSSVVFQSFSVNGQPIGEMAIDASVAGEMGVPVLFAASDDKGVAEAQRFFPGVQTVITKQSVGWNGAISKHPLAVLDEIYDGVCAAASAASQVKPFRFSSPLVFEKRFKRMDAAEQAAQAGSGWERVDPFTIRRTMGSILDLY